jgi:hypothetical protein
MPDVLHALFVAWQNPDTRRFYPVGRLAQIEGNDCQDCFEFVYIQGALQADAFHPFISFPDLFQVYRAQELFPTFGNRLVSQKRADFPQYIVQLGLPPSTISPITILSRSAGRRATDTLELFPLPEFELDYGYRTWFWAHGLRYLKPEGQSRLLRLTPDEQVLPQCDMQNPVDNSAIELLSDDGVRIGYMPSYLLDDAHTLQETCSFCEVYVDRVNLPPAPIRQRLLLRLESCWPDGFVPYSTARYQPLSGEAATIHPPILDGVD